MMAQSSDTPNPSSHVHQEFHSLKIMSINVDSLVSHPKRFDLATFISDNKLNPRYELHFNGFNLIRTDRGATSKGGGTAILNRENLKYEPIFSPSSSNNVILEYTIIKLQLTNKTLYLIAVYANNKDQILYTAELSTLFDKLHLNRDTHFYLLAGNLNSRHMLGGPEKQEKGYLPQALDRLRRSPIETKIKSSVPKYIPLNKTLNYVNNKIRKLHKYKSFAVTQLNRIPTHTTHNGAPRANREYLKYLINLFNISIKAEYSASSSRYWETQIASIDFRKHDNFFRKINCFCRAKPAPKIDDLHINVHEPQLINRCNINPDNLVIRENNYII